MTIGGGFKAVKSVWRYSAQVGPLRLWRAVSSKNACKACSFGTGGQNGGLHNERGRGIEVCNKNIQAHVSDFRPAIGSTVFLQKSIAELGALSAKQLEDLGRLTLPLYKAKGDKNYTPITYEHGVSLCATRLLQAKPDTTFFYASGRSSNEAAFLLQLMARLYGTNNINNCSYYCHQASGVALNATVGTGTATVTYDDLYQADCVFVMGANPASNHPRFVKALIQLKRRGGKVIVVNPAKEPGLIRFASPSDWRSMLKGGERIADEYIQPHLGGDIAFMQGVAKALLAKDAVDSAYLKAHTEGDKDFIEQVNKTPWSEIEQCSGVSQEAIGRVAAIYAQSKATIFTWSMGLTHHLHGVQNIQMLAALALLRGMVGRQGAGLLPLRGHSNIQGTGSMGFTPALKSAVLEALEAQLGQSLPSTPGLDTMACMDSASQGHMKAAVFLGGNILASNPDTAFATSALNAVGFKCFLSSSLNMSHVHGVDEEVVILPVRVRDEESELTTQESMFNFVRVSEGGLERHAQLWSEVEIVRVLGEQLIAKEHMDFSVFESHGAIRQWIAKTVPGFKLLAQVDQARNEFHIDGRILHQPVFPTPSGKAKLMFCQSPARPSGFLLSSIRSEGQFNSIVYHEFDTYRGQTERWVLLMNPEDIADNGWQPGQKLDVKTATGCMAGVTLRPFDVRSGNVLAYYPEANILTPKQVDEHSKTPGFKSVAVDIAPCQLSS